jgi:hypothetical protein
MATAAQITANQLNAQASTGPRTEIGKQTVSRNALAHGLAAKKFFLSEADKPVFAEYRDALAEHYRPATDHERALLEELAEAKWRCRTARIMESSFFEMVVKEQRKADPSLSDEHALARVFVDETLQKRMRLMMRYVAAAERSAEKLRCELAHVLAVRHEEEEYEREREALIRSHQLRAARNPSQLPDATVPNKASYPQLR